VKNIAKDLVARLQYSRWLELLPGYGVSVTAHLLVLLALAMILIQLKPQAVEPAPVEVFGSEAPDATTDVLENVQKPLDIVVKNADAADKAPAAKTTTDKTTFDMTATESALPSLDKKARPLDLADNLLSVTGPSGRFTGELAGRTGTARAKLLSKGGGNSASEKSVSNGLRWLARYQQSDGNWSFRHGPDNPGTLTQCTTAATGLALLAFLGAGHTHRSENSRYRPAVDKGIRYLLSQMKRGEGGGDLRGKVVANEGMYAHAIATLALCEAYGQTGDPKLKEPAQRAINFITAAQDPRGGGWRYSPRQPGDTTVTGWQLMALKSAKSSHLKIPDQTLVNAGRFLDSVQSSGGSRYGYTDHGAAPPMTAIGLLCRMYLGWTREKTPLAKGVEFLSQTGPSIDDIYYDYYATQVLHHWGGAEWRKWNGALRDHLVEIQVKKGDAAGSWDPAADRGAGPGGRLYQTCLSVMTLEVYYRYLPLYQQETAGRK
jgi:hypothetical protein